MVIGAGFGGLSAALSLAAAGVRVRLLEAAPRVGGKADRQQSADGLTFDTGPSLLTLPDVLEAVFRQAGTTTSEHLTLQRLTQGFSYHFADGVRLTLGGEEAVRDALGERSAGEYRDVLQHARRIWEAAAPSFVYGDAPTASALLRKPLGSLAALARIDGRRSMLDAIYRLTRSPHLRTLFTRYATYSGSDPRIAPATLLCIAWVELGLGAYGVQGGLSQVAHALAGRLQALGGELELGCAVDELALDAGRVVGVRRRDGRVEAADLVVSNADTAFLFERLLPQSARGGLRDALGRRSRASAPSMSGWNMVVPGRAQAAHTVLFPTPLPGQALEDAYLEEFAAIFDRGALPRSPTVYVCDQAQAHGGSAALFVMANAPTASAWRPPGSEAQACLRVEADALTRMAAAGLAVSGRPVFRRAPGGLAERFPGSDGALYGAASNSRLAAFLRPANRVPGVPGLYVASGTAHPGGGVPLALLSGLAAARAALKDLRP